MDSVYSGGRYESQVHGANCCNCVSLVLAFFAALSPLFLWNANYGVGFNSYRRIGTGPFVASAISSQWDCGFGCGVIAGQWVYWDEITSAKACTNFTNIYDEWSGKYGFCDQVGGEFRVPSEVKVIQAFIILTLILTSFAVCAGGSVRSTGGKGAGTAGALTFLAMICAIVSFSMISSHPWYRDLNNGVGSLPFFNVNNRLVAVTGVGLYYGPAFASMITVFILTFFSSMNFCVASRGVDDELQDFPDNFPEDTGGAPRSDINLA